MKKYGLLKVIALCFLVAVILSWIIPTGSFSGTTFTAADTIPVGIISLFRLPVVTVQTFIQYFIVILAIGLFYGVVNKTEVYSGIVDGIVKKWKGKEKAFVVIVTIILALLATLTGNLMLLVAVTPFIGAIVLRLNCGKISAMLSTIGAILVGQMSSICGFDGYGYIVNMFNVDMKEDIIVRIVLFAILIGLYAFFVAKKTKVKTEEVKVVTEEKKTRGRKSTKPAPVEEPTKKVEAPLLTDGNSTRSKWPLIIFVIVLFIICIVSMYNWHYGWGVEFFDKLYTSLTSITWGEYPIAKNFFNGLSSFGYWGNYEFSVALFIGSLIIKWIYNIKFDDYVDGAIKGIKEMLPVAFMAAICNIVFTIMISDQTEYLATIVNFIGQGKETFNLPIVTIATLVGSFFYNDLYYLLTDMIGIVLNYDAIYYPIAGVVINAIHTLTMMILPTSLFLVIGLTLYNISLKEWFKAIWAFLIEALVVIIIIAIVIIILI